MTARKRRKTNQPNYQDRYDFLKVAQAVIASLVGSLLFAPDAPAWLLYLLIAAQSGVALSLAITLRHLKTHGVVIDDDEDTPTDERVTLPGYVAKQETRE